MKPIGAEGSSGSSCAAAVSKSPSSSPNGASQSSISSSSLSQGGGTGIVLEDEDTASRRSSPPALVSVASGSGFLEKFGLRRRSTCLSASASDRPAVRRKDLSWPKVSSSPK